MPFEFFSESMNDSLRKRTKLIQDHVTRLPDTDFVAGEKAAICELTAAKFQFLDAPQYPTGDIQRDEPKFQQGSQKGTVTVYIPYSGDITGFRLFHTSSPTPHPSFDCKDGMCIKTYDVHKQNMQKLDADVQADIKLVQQYLHFVREMVPRYNQTILAATETAFDKRLQEINETQKAVDMLAQSKIVLRKRNDGAEQIIIPVQRRPLAITQPKPADPVQEYLLQMTEYDDILRTILSMVKVMERTPEVFAGMNEEPLRTILLVALNGIYEGQATGETFNGYGKTDILIRREDRNAFIAECLMWRGQACLRQKMDEQLFQYAMWRDSKLALIIFNRDRNFTTTIETMKATIRAPPQFVKELDWKHESGARYLFRRHDDPDRTFVLTALAFDVPANAKEQEKPAS